jgi:transposase InsO family protein
MSVRLLIAEADRSSLNVSKFCRDHGIGRDAFYFWQDRFDRERRAGLEDRSRAPKHVANRTADEVEDLIVKIRKDLDDGGLDAGAETIQYWLARQLPRGTVVPCPATIWRVLHRRGFIVPDPSKAPNARQWRSFAAARANECWQMDMTHWQLADGSGVEIINALDDCSRLVVVSRVFARATLATTWEAMTSATERFGWPERMLTDNGSIFGPSFAENLAAVGVHLGHSHPYHPQTCGKVERFHQTLKKRLSALDPAPTRRELQRSIDTFIDYYNQERPHRAIARQTPHHVWTTTPHSGPANRTLDEPSRIYRNNVYDGVVWAGRFRISIGAAHNNHQAVVIITGPNASVFIQGRLVRDLTINPRRPNQPLHKRPGRPTQ